MDTEAIIEYWAAHMRAQNCTDRTIKERRIFILAMLRHTGASSLLAVKKPELVMFLGRADLTGRTKQNYRSTLHTFFTWMQDEELRLDNPAAKLPRPRVETQEANPVTTDELQQLMSSSMYRRTRMMVILYSYEGLRASEIAAVAGDNVDWERKRIRTVEGKGRKVVWRPMHPLTWEAAQDYPREGFWFPGLNGHILGKSVSGTLNAAFKRAGLKWHTAHDMRAWHATEQLERGVHPLTVQYSMRHGDGQSIIKYDLPSDARIRAGREQLPHIVIPLDSRRQKLREVVDLAA